MDPRAYRETTDRAERERIQVAILDEHRAKIRAVVAHLVPRENRTEGEHVGAIGLIVALDRYDASLARDCKFWSFALNFVVGEIRTWLGTGVYWRKDTNRGKSPERRAARAAARAHFRHASMDEALGADANSASLHDVTPAPERSPEQEVSEAEVLGLLLEFAGSLSASDRQKLFSEDRRVAASRHHMQLVERASAFVKGPENDDEADTEVRSRGAQRAISGTHRRVAG